MPSDEWPTPFEFASNRVAQRDKYIAELEFALQELRDAAVDVSGPIQSPARDQALNAAIAKADTLLKGDSDGD